jgi:hypothetical protein
MYYIFLRSLKTQRAGFSGIPIMSAPEEVRQEDQEFKDKPVILAIQEAEIRRIKVPGQPGQTVRKTLS